MNHDKLAIILVWKYGTLYELLTDFERHWFTNRSQVAQ